MKQINRPPSRFEQILGVVLAAVATLAFGAVATFVLTRNPISLPSAAIFSVLFLASATMFFRAALTRRRVLSNQEKFVTHAALLVLGAIGTLAAALWGSGLNRIFLLGSSLSAIAYGLAGISQQGDDA